MIYNFSIPTIEDSVDFTKILRKPISAESMKELVDFNEARKKFKAVLNEAYLKNKSFGELFSSYKETVENYLNVNVDLVINPYWQCFYSIRWDWCAKPRQILSNWNGKHLSPRINPNSSPKEVDLMKNTLAKPWIRKRRKYGYWAHHGQILLGFCLL